MTIRLLLVDDHRMMREGLRALLKEHAELAVVGEAEDGREAIEKARELRPDIVVMDLAMGELNGIDATRQLRAELPHVGVVALSTYTRDDYVLRVLEAGAAAYVTKISAHEELVEAIRAVARGRRFLSPEVTGAVVEAGIHGSRGAIRGAHVSLTRREREVLQLVAEGRTSGEIAARLDLSTRTVEQHRRHIMDKLDLRSVADLTKYAIREHLVSLDE